MALSLDQVAAEVGYPAAQLARVERGDLVAPPDLRHALGRLYGCGVEGLLQQFEDETGFEDYVDGVASHLPPLDDVAVKAAAAVLRRIGQRQSSAGNSAHTGDYSPVNSAPRLDVAALRTSTNSDGRD